jgi:hypothetical protein
VHITLGPPGVWCEDIVLGPELQLRRGDDADHLLVAFDQAGQHGSKVAPGGPSLSLLSSQVTIYFSCIGKGQVHMPVSLRDLLHRMKKSKVKVYHPSELEMTVFSKKTTPEVLEELECPDAGERMQVAGL